MICSAQQPPQPAHALRLIGQPADVQQVAKCLQSKLGEVLSAAEIDTAAHQLLRAIEEEGFSGSEALSQALETCESIKSVQESRAA